MDCKVRIGFGLAVPAFPGTKTLRGNTSQDTHHGNSQPFSTTNRNEPGVRVGSRDGTGQGKNRNTIRHHAVCVEFLTCAPFSEGGLWMYVSSQKAAEGERSRRSSILRHLLLLLTHPLLQAEN